MKTVSNSSYEEDDCKFLGSFLNIHKPAVTKLPLQTFPELNIPLLNLDDDTELNVLYYIAGNILYSTSKISTVCNQCIISASSTNEQSYEYAKLVRLKRYKEHTLYFVYESVFQYFREMENVMRSYLLFIMKILI